MDADYILAVNPGATSTKIAVYRTNKFVFLKTIRHDLDELSNFKKIIDQLDLDIVATKISHIKMIYV